MITREQIKILAYKKRINETTIFREYLQLLFLSELYKRSESRKIFFKGGTALHLIFGAPRFSEDLDFTVELTEKKFTNFIADFFADLGKIADVKFKERKTIAGKRFLMKSAADILPHESFINLDFSFRERVLRPEKSIIKTDYPIIFTSFVYHLSKNEIFAEKIRALLTRKKGRDLYDLWFLLSSGAALDEKLVKEKLKYYGSDKIKKEALLKRVADFRESDFVLDLKPFVPIDEREKLRSFWHYVREYLSKSFSK
jgi:predicted nucleotidyltransferase component of viral defense system